MCRPERSLGDLSRVEWRSESSQGKRFLSNVTHGTSLPFVRVLFKSICWNYICTVDVFRTKTRDDGNSKVHFHKENRWAYYLYEKYPHMYTNDLVKIHNRRRTVWTTTVSILIHNDVKFTSHWWQSDFWPDSPSLSLTRWDSVWLKYPKFVPTLLVFGIGLLPSSLYHNLSILTCFFFSLIPNPSFLYLFPSFY